MRFQVGDIVRVIDSTAFFYNVVGQIKEVTDEDYLVVFIAINDETGEEFIYEDCYYYEDQIMKEEIL